MARHPEVPNFIIVFCKNYHKTCRKATGKLRLHGGFLSSNPHPLALAVKKKTFGNSGIQEVRSVFIC
jgi:hypothetical protein